MTPSFLVVLTALACLSFCTCAPSIFGCGIGSIDLSPLSSSSSSCPTAATDLTFSDADYTYYMNLCGAVHDSQCQSTKPSAMLCQKSKAAQIYALAYFNQGYGASWSSFVTASSRGVTATYTNGDANCYNPNTGITGPRTTTFTFTCSKTQDYTFTLINDQQNPCNYLVSMSTPAACSLFDCSPTIATGDSFDLTKLKGFDLPSSFDSSTKYSYSLDMCGILGGACGVSSVNSAFACSTSIDGTSVAQILAYADGRGSLPSWSSLPDGSSGVALTMTNGDACLADPSSPQSVSVYAYCDPTAASVPSVVHVSSSSSSSSCPPVIFSFNSSLACPIKRASTQSIDHITIRPQVSLSSGSSGPFVLDSIFSVAGPLESNFAVTVNVTPFNSTIDALRINTDYPDSLMVAINKASGLVTFSGSVIISDYILGLRSLEFSSSSLSVNDDRTVTVTANGVVSVKSLLHII